MAVKQQCSLFSASARALLGGCFSSVLSRARFVRSREIPFRALGGPVAVARMNRSAKQRIENDDGDRPSRERTNAFVFFRFLHVPPSSSRPPGAARGIRRRHSVLRPSRKRNKATRKEKEKKEMKVFSFFLPSTTTMRAMNEEKTLVLLLPRLTRLARKSARWSLCSLSR